MKRVVRVQDAMQADYSYEIVAREGADFDPTFTPDLSPMQMLELGVFGGSYLNDCRAEFPEQWFTHAKLSDHGYDMQLNFFGVKASQSRAAWAAKGWLSKEDPRGWFQWYARYYRGRRMEAEDRRQIKRWAAMRRHIAQLQRSCLPGDLTCRPVQRQALLHWAYDSRRL